MKSVFSRAFLSLALATAGSTTPGAARAPYTLSYLTRPTITHGVHGMKFNAAGELFVGDVLGFTLWKVDVKTGRVTAAVQPPFGCADDLAFGADGTMVWTSLLTGQVFGQRPGGQRYVIAAGLGGVNSIGFAPDGRLYVTQLSGRDKLWQLDVRGVDAPRLVLDDVAGLNGFRIDANNVLWGPRGKKGDIIRLDLRTLDLRVIASGFIWPTGVDIDRDGLLYAVDLTAGTLTRIDPRTGRKTLVKQLEPGIDNLTVAKSGLIYVSNSADNSIYEIDPTTAAMRYVRRNDIGVPGGVAVSSSGGADTLYLGDTFSFLSIDGASGKVTDLGRHVGAGAIISATSVRVSQGKLLLSHFDEGRVRVANLGDGNIVRTIEKLVSPYDAIMLANGDIVVAELTTGRLVRVDATDRQIVVADGLMQPVGLVAEDARHVIVTEAARGSLTRVDLETGAEAIIRDGLKRPEGLDRGSDRSLFVAEAGSGELVRIDPTTGARTVLASGLPAAITPPAPMNPVWIPMGVAVGAKGVVYVSLDGVGTVARVVPNREQSAAPLRAKHGTR